MGLFKVSDLAYNDYKLRAYPDDDPHVTGKPDSTLFNRHERYEMIYLINAFMEDNKLVQVTSGKKLELMLREKLPGTIRNQDEVCDWALENWKKYEYIAGVLLDN